jgi:hypothetical protein
MRRFAARRRRSALGRRRFQGGDRMKAKYVKRAVYVLMSALIVFNSLTTELTGKIPHIAAGIAVSALAAVHIWLSRKYFLFSAKNLFSAKLRLKGKINFAVDVSLIVLFAAITFTGVMMALGRHGAFFADKHDTEVFHGVLGGCAVLLIAVHAVLHKRPGGKRPKAPKL